MAGNDTDDREPVFRDASVRFTSGIPRLTLRARKHQDLIDSGWDTLTESGFTGGKEKPDSNTLIKDLDADADLALVRDDHLEENESWWKSTKEKQGVDPAFTPTEPPMIGVLKQWLTRPVEATPIHPKPRASVPSLHRTSDCEMKAMPDLFDGKASDAPDQIPLPGFEPVVTHCPSWILWLYDQVGGKDNQQGRGAPWDMHLFVGAFLHLAIKDRTGQWRTLRFPHLIKHEANWPIPGTPSIERWLFPEGWLKSNRSRDWHRLPEALKRLSEKLGRVSVNGLGSVRLIDPSVIPEHQDDPLVEFTVRVPKSAANGTRTDWNLLRKYRKESATLYRAYLSASAFIDRSAHRGHGITAEIAAPLLKSDGTPVRRKGGKIVRGNELIPNPQGQFVKPLDGKDLTRMIGFDPSNRKHRHLARKAFDALHEDGVIDLRQGSDGLRIFAPNQIKTK